MMKVSGGKCEALELNEEDRKRIEEIKRELLLHTKHTKVRHKPPEEEQQTYLLKYILVKSCQIM